MEGGAAWKCFRWEYVSRRGARKERFCCVGARPGGIVRGKDARVSRLDGESPMRIECEMKVECPEAPFPVFPFQGEDMLRRVVLAALLVLGWFSADAQAHALLAKELASGDARVVAFSYSTGDVAAYAEAKLYGPGQRGCGISERAYGRSGKIRIPSGQARHMDHRGCGQHGA